MTAGFELQGSGVRSVAGSLRDESEMAAQAGLAVSDLGQLLTATPAAGERLLDALQQFSASWCDVLDDMMTSLLELAGWMDDAVTSYFSVDSDAAYRIGTVHP